MTNQPQDQEAHPRGDSEPGETGGNPLREGSLKALALRGSFWTIFGYGGEQVIRLARKLIVARFLFPEAYGIMGGAMIFIQALEMFSDFGLAPSIIQNKRGDDPSFLRTAWTLQVFRGVAIALLAVLMAYPLSLFYGKPQLAHLLPVVALISIISGFNSTLFPLMNRRLEVGRLAFIELTAQFLASCIMIFWAWRWGNVWALILASISDAAIKMLLSHMILPGIRMRFQWDREAARELFGFGKWIFFGTLLTFFVGRFDRVILFKFMDEAQFGCL